MPGVDEQWVAECGRTIGSQVTMSVIARFLVPADQFALGDVLEVRQGIRVRLESMIPTGDALVPYFWVPSPDADSVEEALRESSLVAEVKRVDETEAETLFRVRWATEVNGLIDVIRDSEAALLEAEGLGDEWSFRVRFLDHQDLSAFYRRAVDEGLTLELLEVNDPFGSTRRSEFGITDAQREALTTALEKGYFAVPREITLEQLAADLGISDTAFSQRLRRGLTALLSSALLSQMSDPGTTDGDRED